MMRLFSILTVFLLSAALMVGCKQNATDNGGDLEVSDAVTEQAAYGFQINDVANTSNEIEAVNADPMTVDEAGGTASLNSIRERAQKLAQKAQAVSKEISSLTKVSGDSALYSGEDSTANGQKMRWAYYVNIQNGTSRYVYVIYQFPESRNMVYDSTEIVMSLGFPYGNGDAELQTFYQIQLFKERFFIKSIESTMDFSNYMNGEAQTLSAVTETTFREGNPLSSKKITISWNADHTGTIRRDFTFKDGSTAYALFTFKADFSGTFEKKRRDGTMVTGSFNQVGDDGQGSYNALINFPDGYYIDKIEKVASIALQGEGSLYLADYSEIIFFSSGKIDSSHSTITTNETETGSVTTITATRVNGAHGSLTLTEVTDGTSTMSGYWVTADGHYLDVSAEYFIDGSSHLHYEVYASETAFNNGDDPLLIADYNFNGEQGGSGTITKDGKTYEVTFDGSGQGSISDGTDSKTFNMYF